MPHHVSLADRAGSLAAPPGLHRHAQRQAPRLLPLELQGSDRRGPAHGRHPIRGDRRAPGVSVLGRAGLQGRVRGDARDRPEAHRGVEHVGRRRARRARTEGRHLCRHHEDVDLPGGVRGRRARGDRRGAGRPDTGSRLVRAGQATPGCLRPRDRRRLAALLRGLLRPAVPERQARPAGDPRLRRRGDGESRGDHLPRDGAAGRRARRLSHRARAGRRRGRARERAHVVRRPRHDDLVERHLAQRGVRDVHGDPRGRCVEARVAALDDLRRLARGRALGRRPALHATDRVPCGGPAGRRRDVRRAHLREGRLGAPHARAISGLDGVP